MPENPSTEAVWVPYDAEAARQQRVRTLSAVDLTLGIVAAVVVVATARSADWNLWTLAIVVALTTVSELASVAVYSSKLKISGSFVGLVLAAVLLGGAPASVVGAVTMAVGWFQTRESRQSLQHNLVNFAWTGLLTGLLFHAAIVQLHLGPRAPGFYALAFASFFFALIINFGTAASFVAYRDGSNLLTQARSVLPPLLATEMVSALMMLVAIYFATRFGRAMLALLALTLLGFQYMIGQLMVSQERGVELDKLASTDALTGLINRGRFTEKLEAAIASAQIKRESFAVLLLDLDHFKEINDTLGHQYGDRLLAELGPRLTENLRSAGCELVARLGGDEFAAVIRRPVAQTDELERIAADLVACVQEPVLIDDISLVMDTSVGISRFPIDGDDAQTLLRRADVAMYAAKENRDGFNVYAPEHDRHSSQRLSMLGDLRRALIADEIVVHYQPIIDLHTGSVATVEALVRWEHPDHGILLPDSFLQIVEQTGMIGPLAHRVLESAIAQCASWNRDGRALTVAVNLSVRNLLDPQLPSFISRMLVRYRLPPQQLQLEITESMFVADHDRVLSTIRAVRALGARFAVDDFGTGHSSLANLRLLAVDELKLDRSFVTEMMRSDRDLKIVRSTIGLSHDLGLRIVAEGIEDAETLAHLSEIGCDLAQGFHLAEPMPADQLEAWLTAFERQRDA